jgi:hypothetical protein
MRVSVHIDSPWLPVQRIVVSSGWGEDSTEV